MWQLRFHVINSIHYALRNGSNVCESDKDGYKHMSMLCDSTHTESYLRSASNTDDMSIYKVWANNMAKVFLYETRSN